MSRNQKRYRPYVVGPFAHIMHLGEWENPSPAFTTSENLKSVREGFRYAENEAGGVFGAILESETTVTETCYAKGQKVILVTSQTRNGKWLCTFSIPGFSHLDGGLQGQDPSKGHKTEWEARTNAFQRAKSFLERPQDMTQGHIAEKA